MSRKPAKHSERKKMEAAKQTAAQRFKNSWNSKRDQRTPFPLIPERHLIVSEGTKTEPNYFEELKRRINDKYHGDRIEVRVEGAGMNTLSLFDFAKALADADPDGYTHVWVVYDKDSFPASDFDRTAARCKRESSHSRTFHAAWTNEAFELWYILHFEYLEAALSRDMYAKILTTHLSALEHGPYRKNDKGMFNLLEPLVDTAISNARKLERLNKGKTPSASAPGTKVHELLEYLMPYIRDRG